MGDHAVAPAATGVGAEAGLQAGLDVTEGDTLAEVVRPDRAHVAHRLDAADRAVQHRDHDDASPVVGRRDDLVTRCERVADERIEVRRGRAVDHRQIRPADARQARPQWPSMSGRSWRPADDTGATSASSTSVDRPLTASGPLTPTSLACDALGRRHAEVTAPIADLAGARRLHRQGQELDPAAAARRHSMEARRTLGLWRVRVLRE